MTDRELMQMALDWADNHGEVVFAGGGWNAVNPMNEWTRPLRARLAQPEPEPVAYDINGATVYIKPPVYTAPPQREFIGLTDEEITETLKRFGLGERAALARAIEAKLKEKNA